MGNQCSKSVIWVVLIKAEGTRGVDYSVEVFHSIRTGASCRRRVILTISAVRVVRPGNMEINVQNQLQWLKVNEAEGTRESAQRSFSPSGIIFVVGCVMEYVNQCSNPLQRVVLIEPGRNKRGNYSEEVFNSCQNFGGLLIVGE
ncbi:hypothetical protein CEXT_754971 [Caerostris extrusa]|uniref:Uncharacterized protein n=1 Tax=Caerostris extrusa TaxID=172846 RepID=A0AAV4TPS4_CAEEX|nr:hypothetical protein CEXT_754971 [Caerostris extrusa]